MLRKIRIGISVVLFALITFYFLDFANILPNSFHRLAHIQFVPAVLSLSIGILIVLIALTLLFGRIYCSTICPMGIWQDVIARISKSVGKKKKRYRYSPAKNILRWTVLGVTVIASVCGFSVVLGLLDPYSAYGRIVVHIFKPVYMLGNNLLESVFSRFDNYTFYQVDTSVLSLSSLLIAILTFAAILILAWKHGRTWCNTICPVGTVLGFMSRYSIFKPVIDTSKCNGCGLCARNCKASCIDAKAHKIDYSRCVVCMNCLGKCKKGAIKYTRRIPEIEAEPEMITTSKAKSVTTEQVDNARRSFLSASAIFATTAALKAQEKKVDGGLATIEDKKIPHRENPILPPGSLSARNFAQHCTACQLCVSVCPNQVLRPSGNLLTLMQPEMSYERGYCRPECAKCAEVCPTDAIHLTSLADKSAIQIGHAVWIKENCVPLTDGVECGNCARHCPTGAIQMVVSDPDMADSPKIPVVNAEKCIGCGACENLCPSRPFSAIYVTGHQMHRII